MEQLPALLEYSPLGIATLSLIVLLVMLRQKNNGRAQSGDVMSQSILQELQTMNQNHLHSIQKSIEEGNRNLVQTIHEDNKTMIQLLGEIKGTLSKG